MKATTSRPARPSRMALSPARSCSPSLRKVPHNQPGECLQEVYRLRAQHHRQALETFSRHICAGQVRCNVCDTTSSSRSRLTSSASSRRTIASSRWRASPPRPSSPPWYHKASRLDRSFIPPRASRRPPRPSRRSRRGKLTTSAASMKTSSLARLIPAGTGLEHYRSIQLLVLRCPLLLPWRRFRKPPELTAEEAAGARLPPEGHPKRTRHRRLKLLLDVPQGVTKNPNQRRSRSPGAVCCCAHC